MPKKKKPIRVHRISRDKKPEPGSLTTPGVRHRLIAPPETESERAMRRAKSIRSIAGSRGRRRVQRASRRAAKRKK